MLSYNVSPDILCGCLGVIRSLRLLREAALACSPAGGRRIHLCFSAFSRHFQSLSVLRRKDNMRDWQNVDIRIEM